MADYMDPDVQDELQAMTGGSRAMNSNQPPRGDLRSARLSRPLFSIDNAGPSMISNTVQQSSRSLSPPLPTPTLTTTEKATKMDLIAILKKPAHTSEEKYKALDARDKLIRLTTVKNVDIKKATSTQGVCPDMCPEKERMARESQHRVAKFESLDGSTTVMNYGIAVKEYSRSSADQESPLPHELRPEPILKLTMTYLLQNIMDLCDDPETSTCDWYHFLWDRTRSIRKDITQQELCSPETVLLVEQCARFHIHCAARLIDEEPQVFDQKINTENLTKCLQSLKYMYHDLDLKMIRCKNEAEFRAYVVLLNLHDSNFLWEVKQLREELQQSPEIQFAIKVYLAIESNNYVRFFSLVRSTTYMNACILLRYFNQVRIKALHIMFKAYAPRNGVHMPISNLTYLLAFESSDQCAHFLEYYGLKCELEYDRVTLHRGSFDPPDTPFLLDRAVNVIEHKRHSSVGEAVHGRPLERKNVLEEYEPHDSFDEKGIMLPKAWSAEDQNYYKPEARIEARTEARNQVREEARSDARMNKAPANREDENIFKMPMAPAKTSPRARLSPKTVVFSENVFSAPTSNASNSSSIFGASKLTPSSQNSSSGFMKVQQNQAAPTNNLFGNFNQTSQQSNLFGNSSSKDSQSSQLPKAYDTSDGSSFKFTNNSTFGKPAENTSQANSIFSSAFSSTQKVEPGAGLFGQVQPPSNQNLFGNAAANSNSKSLFSGFSSAAPSQPVSIAGYVGIDSFRPQNSTGSSFQPPASGLFGGFKGNTTSIPGIVPMKDSNVELAQKLEREKEEARQKEAERRKKEAEELAQKRIAEMEEAARKRKKAAEEEEQRRKQALERKRLEEIANASKKCVDEIIDEFIKKNVEEFANAEIKRHRAIEESINKIYVDLVNEVTDTEIKKIALEVQAIWEKNVLAKYFTGWLEYARKKKQQRQKIANTPIWMPVKSMKEVVPQLHHPLQSETLSLMKRYRTGVPIKLIAPPIREDNIDLWSIITPELSKIIAPSKSVQSQNIYWKCVISVPDSDEDPCSKTMSRWLNNVFNRQVSKYPRQDDIFFVEQHVNNHQRVNVCMRKLTGKRLLTETQTQHSPKDLEGTNAILFLMTAKNLNATRIRLKAVLQALELNSAAGLVIYNLENNDLNDVKQALDLYECIDIEKADECVFANGVRNRSVNNLCHLTKHGLKYIASNSLYDDQLEMQQIVSFLRICLADELWQRIYLSISRNPTLLEASTRFDFLVDYHNDAIDRLISVCSPSGTDSPTLFPFELRKFVPKHQLDIPLGLEYFPADWHTNFEQHQHQFEVFLKSLQIHRQFDLKVITESSELETSILRFVYAHIPSELVAERTTCKMMQHILAYLGSQPLNSFEFKEKLAKYSWLDAFPIFATDLLSFQYQRFYNEQRLPDYVIYDKYEYQEFTRNAWWLQTNEGMLKDMTANVLRDIDAAVDEYEQSCKRQRLEETLAAVEDKKNIDDILAKGYASLAKADKTLQKIKQNNITCKDLSKDLDHDLYRQEKCMNVFKYTWKDFKH